MIIMHARFSRRKIGTGYLTIEKQIINRLNLKKLALLDFVLAFFGLL